MSRPLIWAATRRTSSNRSCRHLLAPRSSADKPVFGASRSRPNFDQQIGLEGRSMPEDLFGCPSRQSDRASRALILFVGRRGRDSLGEQSRQRNALVEVRCRRRVADAAQARDLPGGKAVLTQARYIRARPGRAELLGQALDALEASPDLQRPL